MKKIAFGIACGMAAVFVLTLMLTLYGRIVRKQETDTALAQAADSALSNVMSEHNTAIEKNEDFTADFLKSLLIQTNSDSDLTVSVLDADYEYGILSAEIVETYAHPNGKKGSVSERRTVIFDKPVDENIETRTVSFYTDGELYKNYTIQKDSVCTLPVPPKKEGAVFRCWRFVTGGTGVAQSMETTYANGRKKILSSGGAPYLVSKNTKLTAVFD